MCLYDTGAGVIKLGISTFYHPPDPEGSSGLSYDDLGDNDDNAPGEKYR